MGKIQEPQVTWWDMDTTTHNKFTTGLPQLFPSRLTHHLSPAVEVMPLGSAGKQAIPISLLVQQLVVLMPMTTLLIEETIISKLSLLPTTMLLFLVYWHD